MDKSGRTEPQDEAHFFYFIPPRNIGKPLVFLGLGLADRAEVAKAIAQVKTHPEILDRMSPQLTLAESFVKTLKEYEEESKKQKAAMKSQRPFM